jgi:hypothetical protein
LAVLAISTLGAIWLICDLVRFPKFWQTRLGDDGYKLFFQFSLITVVGGVISMVVAELKREQERREARREALWAFHTTAVSAYNEAKKARRLLCATAIDSSAKLVRPDQYLPIMIQLEDVQLKFESLKRQVKFGPHLFSGSSKVRLRGYLKSLEGFLRDVLKEFETATFSSTGSGEPLSKFTELRRFVSSDRNCNLSFHKRFIDTYDEFEADLLRLITK